ncbi:sensor histidine kinase [Carboxylicivirga marina]|uniref:Histidine kinase n=1 Tax=Carboxylicivirga marina TaxID=2800988 RepID=A0ABS1HDY4_9BACT|nr:histidine kinase [Carboxylicivirga marina]MBK3515782.1 histidine kinase [Carboxylicivirga marina]
MPYTDKHTSLTEHAIFVCIWLLILASPVIFIDYNNVSIEQRLLGTWLRLLPFFLLSIINHFILVPLILFRKNKWTYFITAIFTILTFVVLIRIVQPQDSKRRPIHTQQSQLEQPDNQKPLPPKHLQARNKNRAAIPPQVNIFILSILILGFDTGIRTAFRWMRLEKDSEVLEKEKVKSELAFLRNQVSPHFFMNTLNNIHSLIDFNIEEAKDSIIHLSKLMRHLLYNSNDEHINIGKEMDFIRHYIDLMKLRYSNKVDIQLQINEHLPDVMIPPLLFTSYVENAFKHGVSYQHHSFIYININCSSHQLEFSIRNSNHQTANLNEPSGIGAENSRKRLNLLYGNNYTLEEENSSEHYLIKLTLPL